MGTKPYYVYTLAYPIGFVADGQDLSGVVFYVGKGTVLKEGPQRIDTHEVAANAKFKVNERKCQVIQQIIASGMKIQKQIIFESDSERDALDHEAGYIKTYAGPHLTNRKTYIYRGELLPPLPAQTVPISQIEDVSDQQSLRTQKSEEPVSHLSIFTDALEEHLDSLSWITVDGPDWTNCQ